MGAEQRGETPAESDLTRARGAKVRGVSFWHAALQSQTIELNTHDDLDLDAGRSRWAVSSIPGKPGVTQSNRRRRPSGASCSAWWPRKSASPGVA